MTWAIRKAVQADLPGIVALAAAGYVECKLPGEFSPTAYQYWWDSAMGIGFASIYLLEVETGLTGFLAAVYSADMFTGRRMMSVAQWYVTPIHRGYGPKLFEAAMNEARQRGVEVVATGVLLNEVAKRLPRFYRARGFRLQELTYIKELR